MNRDFKIYFPALDVLRALAILMVIYHHCPGSGVMAQLKENGRYGVSLFFLISGYLITTLFLKEEKTNGVIGLSSFFKKRIGRIFPLYYLALGLEVVIVYGAAAYSPENQALFGDKLLSYVTFTSNLRVDATQGPFFFAWSLAIEEQFYLLFALGFAFFRKGVFLAAGVLLALEMLVFALLGPSIHLSLWWRVGFSFSEAILVGVIIAAIQPRHLKGRRTVSLLSLPLVFLTLGGVLTGLLSFHHFEHSSDLSSQGLYFVMGLLVLSATYQTVPDWFLIKVLCQIGKVSFGIYLFHMFVINALKRSSLAAWLYLLASATITFLLALASYKYFEKPLIEGSRSWAHR